MPNLEDVVDRIEDALDWLDMFSNELVIGGLVALLLVIWFAKGREPPVRPA